MSIRAHLRALVLLTLLPVAIFGVAGGYLLVEMDREVFERGVRDRVRALMTAIDAELRGSIATLEVLARSPSLERGDLSAFRAEAERALETRHGDWINVLVSHPETAEKLLNLLVPPGAPLPVSRDPTTILEAAQSGSPTVSKVSIGAVLKRPLFAVRAPVMHEGKVRYVLSAIVETATIARLVERQVFPDTWAVAVLDESYRFVVRQPAPAQANEFASESLKQALAEMREGWQRGQLIDGSEIYRAFDHSSVSRWSASIAVPRSVVLQSLHGVWLLCSGLVAAAALGLWLATRLAGRISQPIAALAAAAPALGRGETTALPPSGPVPEVRALARALAEAASATCEREERQRLAEQALRAGDRAKDEFLAVLGHELRNPLASVSNVAQLLKLAQRQPTLLDNVSDILGRQVEHMTRLVDDLLEVGRVTGGKIQLVRASLDFARVAADVIETWQSARRFRHHQIRTDLQTAWVFADRARIEQVISNLLDNALKYTPAGGEIRVAVRPQGASAILEVRDTGVGMAPELIARAFDLFVQGERTHGRNPGGLGIGLTMAKLLVELHDGSIQAASDGAGKGATFRIALPAIERPAALAAVMPAQHTNGGGRRILIIEDDPDARESLATLLRSGGHDVHTAETGTQGIDMAGALALEFVLIDIGLPDLDGYAVARRLRGDATTHRLRLIALTGYGAQEDRFRALAAGFDEHLPKPADLEMIEAILRSLATVG